ncbi:MAG: hypothetical protein ACK4IS_05900 [Erythrobacter sp.]
MAAGEFSAESLAALPADLRNRSQSGALWMYDFEVWLETSARQLSQTQVRNWERHIDTVSKTMHAHIRAANRGTAEDAKAALASLALRHLILQQRPSRGAETGRVLSP